MILIPWFPPISQFHAVILFLSLLVVALMYCHLSSMKIDQLMDNILCLLLLTMSRRLENINSNSNATMRNNQAFMLHQLNSLSLLSVHALHHHPVLRIHNVVLLLQLSNLQLNQLRSLTALVMRPSLLTSQNGQLMVLFRMDAILKFFQNAKVIVVNFAQLMEFAQASLLL